MSDDDAVSVTLTLRVPEQVRERVAQHARAGVAFVGWMGRWASNVVRGKAAEIATDVVTELRSPEAQDALRGLRLRADSLVQRINSAAIRIHDARNPEPPDPTDDDDAPDPIAEPNARGER